MDSKVINCSLCRNLFSQKDEADQICSDCKPAPVKEPAAGEALLSQINAGRTASIFKDWLDPIFSAEETSLVESMKTNFRNGKYTELLLASHVAQLCAIDNLRDRIKAIATKGDSAAKLFEGGNDGSSGSN